MPLSPSIRFAFRPGRRAALVAGACAGAAVALPIEARSPRASAPAVRPPTVVAPLALDVPGAEQPVRLESLAIETEVAGGVAETRVEMVFRNPNARVLEGRLSFPLGPEQSVVGFALDVEGRLREAVPVPKARAEQVFEDISRQRVDPGLLQQVAGNRYELRLYPLPSRGTRNVVLRLAEPAGARLVLPLAFAAGLPVLSRLDVAVRYPAATAAPALDADAGLGLVFAADAAGGWTARRVLVDRVPPSAPVVVRGPASRGPEITTEIRGADAWFSLVLPVEETDGARFQPRPLPRRVQIVWDGSASMGARDRSRELALLDAYFRQAGTLDAMLVRVADAAQPPERHAVRGGDWSTLRRALEATVYDGASRLGAVVHDGVSTEALWFSDGLSTWGAPWRPAFPVPVRAIVSALGADRAALGRLAESSGGRLVDLVATDDDTARRALLGRGSEAIDVAAVGARDVLLASRHPSAGRLAIAGAFEGASRTAELVLRLRRADGRVESVPIRVERDRHGGRLAGVSWARLALAAVAGDAPDERARAAEIGQRFAMPSAGTSLLVLERASDYARHGIAPPPDEPALVAEVKALVATAGAAVSLDRAARIGRAVQRFERRVAWWSRDFAKAPHESLVGAAPGGGTGSAQAESLRRGAAPAVPAPAAAAEPSARREAAASSDRMALSAAAAPRANAAAKARDGADPADARIAIALRPAPADAGWLRQLERAAPAERPALYLAAREGNRQSVGFFLEAADWFLARGDRASRAIGLTALSNLAELDVPSRQLLRLLAYRLGQAGEHDLAVAVFERVRRLAPHEPQSHRDLGLALAARDAPGDRQRAVAALHEVVAGSWDGRFPDIDLIALAELNTIVARAAREGRPLDTAGIDARLLRNLPLDLRVVLAWDADDTDVDLHVVDPDGDTVYYGRPLSRQGGAITRDATGGYGPEEFALRVARPGKYRVEAHFFGHRQQVLTSSTGLMLWLSSGFGTAAQEDRRTTLRIASQGGQRVVVGELEVR